MNLRALRSSPGIPGVIAAGGLVLIVLRPEATNLTRAGTLLCSVIVTASLLLLARRNKLALRLTLAALAGILLTFICPFGGRVSPEEERAHIVEAAKSYDGVPYVWGGESPRGIDCSGLIRRAYMDAALSLAWKNASPTHLRRAARLWLFDQSAHTFENHEPISGKRISALSTLRGETPVTVLPGDVAIVASGAHVQLYLGEHRWIQADPSLHRVHEDDARTSKNIWLNGNAVILRPGFLSGK